MSKKAPFNHPRLAGDASLGLSPIQQGFNHQKFRLAIYHFYFYHFIDILIDSTFLKINIQHKLICKHEICFCQTVNLLYINGLETLRQIIENKR